MGTGREAINSAMSHHPGRPELRRAPVRALVSVPSYTGLKIVGWLLIIDGFLWFIMGAIWIVAVLLLAVLGEAGAHEPRAAGALLVGGYSILMAVVVFLIGISQIGFGQLLLAIRDMAINSFYLIRL